MSPCSWRHTCAGNSAAVDRRVSKRLFQLETTSGELLGQGGNLSAVLGAGGCAQAHRLEGFRHLAGGECTALGNLLTEGRSTVTLAGQRGREHEDVCIGATQADAALPTVI